MRILEVEMPALAPKVQAEIDARISAALDQGSERFGEADAAEIFFDLPIAEIESALAGTMPNVQSRLLERAAPHFSEIARLPHVAFHLSEAGLNRLIDLGLRYDNLVQGKAAELWLARGAPFGETAFRRNHPRKNPVFAFWEANGLKLPKQGLCPEGTDMVVSAIREMNTSHETKALRAALQKYRMDRRLLLALILHGSDIPTRLRNKDIWRSRFPGQLGRDLVELFLPAQSSHIRLAQAEKLSRVPPPEDLLALSYEDFPKDLESLLRPRAA